jgi:hypothetical protein
VGVKRKRENR